MPSVPLRRLTLLALAAWLSAGAQETGPDPADQPLAPPVEYAGIVTSQVSTNLGHLFVTRFTEAWSRQPQRENVVLEVRERSSPRYGTEVRVTNGEDEVFRGVLPRSAPLVAEMAEQAATSANDRLAESALQQLLFNDADMAKRAY